MSGGKNFKSKFSNDGLAASMSDANMITVEVENLDREIVVWFINNRAGDPVEWWRFDLPPGGTVHLPHKYFILYHDGKDKDPKLQWNYGKNKKTPCPFKVEQEKLKRAVHRDAIGEQGLKSLFQKRKPKK